MDRYGYLCVFSTGRNPLGFTFLHLISVFSGPFGSFMVRRTSRPSLVKFKSGEQCSFHPGWLGDARDENLPSYIGIILSQYKDPYKPISIMECHRGLVHAAQVTSPSHPSYIANADQVSVNCSNFAAETLRNLPLKGYICDRSLCGIPGYLNT